MKLPPSAIFLLVSFLSLARAYTDNSIFRQTFEDPTVDDWNFHDHIRVQDYISGGSPFGRILRTRYNPNDRGSPRITKKFPLDEEVTSATLSYDLKFHSQFEFVKGGKLHGLGGGTQTTGCDPIDPNGWSVRLTWDRGVPKIYVYHQDRVARCGDSYYPESNFEFELGQWYRIDLQVKMNSSPDVSDGKSVLYIDGEKLVEVSDLRLSGNANVIIDTFKFSTFYGGSSPSWAPSKTTYAYWDNFAVNKGLRVTGKKGTECEIFLGGIYSPTKDVCCDNLCGSCGGKGCGGLPGGSRRCCTGSIVRSDIMCDAVANAPCKF
mmetsp:Transcript_38959/g.81507  ORF Transcript_38959/g.81507 Transcript_38959/m.81507 type:complete len:320 (-) Transcript_38959:215-1174(-)